MKTVNIQAELRAHVARKYITQKAAAAAWKVSPAMVCSVLKGERNPTAVMLEDAGFECVQLAPAYRKIKEEKK